MLRYARILMIMAFMAVATAVDSAQGQCSETYSTTFTAASGEAWDDPANWDNGLPRSTTIACISGAVEVVVLYKMCRSGVDQYKGCAVDADCPGSICKVAPAKKAAAIIVDSNQQITFQADSTLTLYGHWTYDSRLDGLLEMGENLTGGRSHLLFDGEVTIVGKGGIINAHCLEYRRVFFEEVSGSSGKLILEGGHTCSNGDPCSQDSDCYGSCTASGTPNDREDSIVVRGQVELTVELVNNAYIVGQAEDPVRVEVGAKSGNGWWIGEAIDTVTPICLNSYDGGLDIQVGVTGSGSWYVSDVIMDSVIIINSPCTSLTGDVDIDAHFDVNENFTTTGSLVMDRLGGKIDVASGKKAQFD